ncbi:olfactory receptor 6C3-like, partial [Melospiza melodia melodia]|uniref:olfactory receptor 6C3-like n=1 Tax=Melospiza melodia melodia TaxID=1914991 RepID=UPI002FD52F1A
SYTGCASQVFFFVFYGVTEHYLLTIMCYDCYVSICKPLHYGTLLGIFRVVLRIPSEQGWHKAFSTCLPNLVVVSLFISTSVN